jgi:glycosyltransferase involved in cell wall biosynthesis
MLDGAPGCDRGRPPREPVPVSEGNAARWLWITPEISDDLTTGALKYSHELARAIAERGVEVTMVGAGRQPPARSGSARSAGSVRYEMVHASFRRPWQSLGSSLPNQSFACSVRAVRSRVQRLVDRGGWDVIAIDGLQAAWVTPMLERRRGGARIVYLAHNHESSMRREVADAVAWTSPRRPVLELEARKTHRLEQRTVHLADVVSSITDDDRIRFEAAAPDRTYVVVSPGWTGTTPAHPVPASRRPRRVGILGSFEWHVKQESLRRFLCAADPLFHDADVELHVAGSMPDDFRSELEPELRATHLMGWVDDSAEFLGQCRIGVVSESLGGGFKLKALDYVFNVVTLASLRHNLAGLPLTAGESVIAADDEDGLARSIVAIIDDGDLLDRYAARAIDRCREQFSWAAAAGRLVDAAGTAG